LNHRSYYDVLRISSIASQAVIRRAYRRLAAEYHPDRNQDPEAEELFKELTEAYHVLSDPELRQKYDRESLEKPTPAANGQTSTIVQPSKAARGADLQVSLAINITDVAHGAVLEIDYQRQTTCLRCGGFGRLSKVDGACVGCNGAGRRKLTRKLEVTIPAGIEDGTRIKIAGQGDDGTLGGSPGDLFVLAQVLAHPLLKRNGLELACRVPISIALAALGGQVEVPTPDGVFTITVPPGTQNGQVLRLRHKGLPQLNRRARGDLQFTFEVVVPTKLNREMREAFKHLAEFSEPSHHPAVQEYLTRLEACKK
jgi:molecular chaperone DnaJ